MYGKTGSFKRVVSTCSVRYINKGSSKKLLEFLANMPKDNSLRIAEAQRQRYTINKKNDKLGASTIYLQVVGSGARGAPNTLYLFTDRTRYLFNCGEGTQRLAHEHKVKLAKLEHIFITNKTWRNIGGLPGISLTLQDVGVPSITLHGPDGLDELYNATKRFVVLKDMTVKMAECSPSKDFNDNVMNVKYILLGPDSNVLENDPLPAAKRAKLEEDSINKDFEEFIHDDTDYYNKAIKTTDKNKSKCKSRSPEKGIPEPILTRTEQVLKNLQKRSNYTVAYICTFQKRIGNLDLKKCVERGVKPGPLLGRLKMGEDIVLPDGTLVLSKDVKTPDDPGPVLIVLEVPDLSYLKEAEFSAHFDNGANPPENVPTIIVHYTPPHVFHHPTYRAFMSMFGPRTRHLVLNAQNSCLGSEAVHRTQHRLHLLDADMFPLLRDASVPAVWRARAPPPHPLVLAADGPDSPARQRGLEELKNKIALAQFQNIINMDGSCKGDGGAAVDDSSGNNLEIVAGRTLTTFHIRPKREFDRSAEPKLLIQDYIQEVMNVDGFATSLEQFRKLVDGMRYAKNGTQKEYPKVVFLGTGSCIPSKTRNTSAIVLHIDEKRSMLLDCGEGTFGQLVRFYGPRRVDAFLRTLNAIYISHLHADHHIGLIGVLQARQQALRADGGEGGAGAEPLQLLAPGQIVSWLATYDANFERIRDEFALLPNQNLMSEEGAPAAALARMGVRGVRTCYVAHCPNAFGVALQLDERHKITYSGDTIPCDELVELGKGSTLLIHEATMEDELEDEARVKMHSTTSQAIDTGRRMGAAYTLLTHFSQRYARLPRLSAHILNDNASVGIAFDNMQITMSDLELLPHMYAPLQLMFAEHCVELELKAERRAHRSHRTHDQSANGPIVAKKETGVHPPKYRDSNASRLRQELRRMTGSSPAKRRRTRSRSDSCSSHASRRTPTPKSHDSENVSPERSDVITSARNNTVASNVEIEDRSKVTTKVIDTRSKTLNSAVSVAPATSKVSEKRKSVIKTVSSTPPPKEVRSGYGKPLVTPINKHLVIRKVSNDSSNACNEILHPATNVIRCRSPIKSWRAENRPSNAVTTANKRDLNKSKLHVVMSVLVHLIVWRLLRILSAVSGARSPLVVTVVSVAILFWTAAKSSAPAGKARLLNAAPRDAADKRPKSSAPSNFSKYHVNFAELRSGSPRRANSADRKPYDTRSLPQTKGEWRHERNVKNFNSVSGSKTSITGLPRSTTPTARRQHSQEGFNIKSPAKSSDTLSEKQKRVTTNATKNKFGNPGSKSFKPQLEDIKSSYLLLNQKKLNRNINTTVNDGTFIAPSN